jgi:hypothetical protein
MNDGARRDLRRALDCALGLGVASARDVAQAQRRVVEAGDLPSPHDVAAWLDLPDVDMEAPQGEDGLRGDAHARALQASQRVACHCPSSSTRDAESLGRRGGLARQSAIRIPQSGHTNETRPLRGRT